jgi:hypothetical protein
MAHVHVTIDLQSRIAAARSAENHPLVDVRVAKASRRLTDALMSGEIGLEWFASEMRAVLAAAGW